MCISTKSSWFVYCCCYISTFGGFKSFDCESCPKRIEQVTVKNTALLCVAIGCVQFRSNKCCQQIWSSNSIHLLHAISVFSLDPMLFYCCKSNIGRLYCFFVVDFFGFIFSPSKIKIPTYLREVFCRFNWKTNSLPKFARYFERFRAYLIPNVVFSMGVHTISLI